jgi:uncharacterized protein
MVQLRETAHRLFAAEYNASRVEIKGADERSASYVVSPLGAKINRVFIVGVLTDVEAVGADGNLWRARVSDPTGVFTLYSGQYQPEATAHLSALSPPAYVAVVGKSRTYEPEPGQFYVSVRPESVTPVDEETRNQWILDAAQRTAERIKACRAAKDLEAPAPTDLEALGVPNYLTDGVLLAKERYAGDVDLDYFHRTTQEALRFLESGEFIPPPEPAAQPAVVAVTKAAPKGPGDEIEEKVLGIIRSHASQSDKGAQWDAIVADGQKADLSEEVIEDAINALMDKGVIYEPILGRLKVT